MHNEVQSNEVTKSIELHPQIMARIYAVVSHYRLLIDRRRADVKMMIDELTACYSVFYKAHSDASDEWLSVRFGSEYLGVLYMKETDETSCCGECACWREEYERSDIHAAMVNRVETILSLFAVLYSGRHVVSIWDMPDDEHGAVPLLRRLICELVAYEATVNGAAWTKEPNEDYEDGDWDGMTEYHIREDSIERLNETATALAA